MAEEAKPVAPWRTALGWTFTLSIAYQFIVHPLLVFAMLYIQPAFPVEKLPKLDWQELVRVLLAMLGLSL